MQAFGRPLHRHGSNLVRREKICHNQHLGKQGVNLNAWEATVKTLATAAAALFTAVPAMTRAAVVSASATKKQIFAGAATANGGTTTPTAAVILTVAIKRRLKDRHNRQSRRGHHRQPQSP